MLIEDTESVALKTFMPYNGVFRLRGHRSKLVKTMFVQTITLSNARKDHIYTLEVVRRGHRSKLVNIMFVRETRSLHSACWTILLFVQ